MHQSVQILGRLGSDPELKTNNQGKKFTQLSIAVGKKWKDKDGNPQEKTTWFSVHVRENFAENVCKYLKKGRMVFVEAEYESWNTEKDGKKEYFHMFKAERVVFVDSGERRQGNGEAAANHFASDDIPF